jgi:hypothetical protein
MSSKYEDLEKLANLRNKGIITEEEFNEKKLQILNLENNKQSIVGKNELVHDSVPLKPSKTEIVKQPFFRNWKLIGIILGSIVLIAILLKVFGLFPQFYKANVPSNLKDVQSTSSSTNFYPVNIGDKWGYIDQHGNLVINPQFDCAVSFHEGLAGVKIGGKTGYIDKSGNIVINPQFDQAVVNCVSDFHEGLATVYINGKNGYIDKSGNYVISPQFDWADSFHEGLAAIQIGKKWGYIDKSGNIVISPQFDHASDFQEGLAAIQIGGKFGYIDKNVKYVINPQFDWADSFHEGLAAIQIGKKWGYIDKSGNIVINPQFNSVYNFQEGLAAVEVDNKWGYIDKSGKYVINPQFEPSRGNITQDFHEGLAAVEINDKFGYLDKTGNIAIKPQFDLAEDFHEGLAYVRIGDKWGYIDKSGKYVWPQGGIIAPPAEPKTVYDQINNQYGTIKIIQVDPKFTFGRYLEINGKKIKEIDNDIVSFEKKIKLSNSYIVLVLNDCSGSACGYSTYNFVTLKPDKSYSISKEFVSTAEYKLQQHGEKITLQFNDGAMIVTFQDGKVKIVQKKSKKKALE